MNINKYGLILPYRNAYVKGFIGIFLYWRDIYPFTADKIFKPHMAQVNKKPPTIGSGAYIKQRKESKFTLLWYRYNVIV